MSVAPETRRHPVDRGHYHPLSWLERRAAAFAGPRDQVGWLVLAGRVILIWLPVFFLFAQSLSPVRAVFAATVVSAVWTMGLRAALSAYFTLGPAVASAVAGCRSPRASSPMVRSPSPAGVSCSSGSPPSSVSFRSRRLTASAKRR